MYYKYVQLNQSGNDKMMCQWGQYQKLLNFYHWRITASLGSDAEECSIRSVCVIKYNTSFSRKKNLPVRSLFSVALIKAWFLIWCLDLLNSNSNYIASFFQLGNEYIFQVLYFRVAKIWMVKTFRLLEYPEWKHNIDSSHSKLEKGAIYIYMESYSQN